jgi:iron complex outermembrane receptor protein
VPITVLDREMLEATGTASLGHALYQLSWQSNSINGQFNNGGDGSTRIGLRGLTPTRTLVLVNGRRGVQGGTGADASVDLESIPLALVERVEIVRGPAVRHGPGAIGGVVNVVTREDLDGAEATLFSGSTADGLGVTYDASAALGHRFDRGRVVVAGGFYQQGAIGAGDRDFSKNDVFYDWETGEVTPFGSTSTPQGFVSIPIGPDGNPDLTGNELWQRVVQQNAGSFALTRDPSFEDGWRGFNSNGNADAGEGDLYNYQPENYLVTPLQRFHLFGAGEYEIADAARAFFEASYANRRSEQQLAPEPFTTISSGLVVSADSVYNPFGREFQDVRRRVIEAGNRRTEQDIDTLRLVAGLAGTLDLGLGSGWSWEASYGFGATRSTERELGHLRTDRLAAALGPSFIDASGVARCGSADNPGDPGCVPFDLFGGPGSITPAMLDYVGHTGTNLGTNEQHTIAAGAGGDLLRTPTGAGLAVQAGAEYRQDSGSYTPDPLSAAGNTTGNRLLPFEGSVEVASLHAELTATPYADAAAGHALELNAAARSFEHSASGMGMTWQLGGVLRLGGSLALRGSQARNQGTPTLTQLFTAGSEGFPAVSDPCDTSFGRSPEAEANCSADGLSDGFTDGRRQLPSRTGGNPELQAEIADILSAGVVIAPEFAPGVSASADYFAIAVTDTVASLGAGAILQNCYEQAPGQRTDCDRVVRDPATGAIQLIDDSLANRGSVETAGIDVQLAYDSDTTAGRMRVQVGGVWLQKYEQTSADGVTRAGQGVYDLGVHPERKLDATVLWDNGLLGAGAHVRHVGGFRECENNDCSVVDSEFPPRSREIEGYTTADVLGSLTLRSGLGETKVVVGVRNLLDRQPPALYNGFLGTSDASTYDFAGRYAYARLVQQF